MTVFGEGLIGVKLENGLVLQGISNFDDGRNYFVSAGGEWLTAEEFRKLVGKELAISEHERLLLAAKQIKAVSEKYLKQLKEEV